MSTTPAWAGNCPRGQWSAGLLVAVALVCSSAIPSFAAWTHVAPGGGGFFTHSGAGPSGILIVTSDLAGVYRSADRGASWTCLGAAAGFARTHASCVAFDPKDSTVVYVGAEDGLYRSADKGQTFALALPGGYVPWIAPFTGDPRIVYALRHPAYNDTIGLEIWKSQDRGRNWSRIAARGLPPKGRGVKLLTAPNDAAHLYLLLTPDRLVPSLAVPSDLLESRDGGLTWIDLMIGVCPTCRPLDVAVDPAAPSELWLTTFEDAGRRGAIGRLAAGKWTRMGDRTGALIVRRGAGAVSEVLVVDVERDPGDGRAGFWKSSDHGATWSRVSDGTTWDRGWNGSLDWAFGKGFCVAKTLGLDLSDDRAWTWTTSQFVHRTRDAGATFTNLYTRPAGAGRWTSTGIDNACLASLSAAGATVYAGWWDLGIWKTDSTGAAWESCNDAAHTGAWRGEGGNCLDVVADPARPNVVWATQGEKRPEHLLISTTAASRDGWQATTGLPSGAFLCGLALDPASPPSRRTLFVTANGALFRSVDDGRSFVPAGPGPAAVRAVAARGPLVFAGGEGGLWRSLDGGVTFARLAAETFPMLPTPGTLKQLKWEGPHAILIVSRDTVLIAARGPMGGVYRTTRASAPHPVWVRVWNDPDAMSLTRAANGVIYAGSSRQTQASGAATSRGLFRSRDGGATFCSVTARGRGECDRPTTLAPWPFALPIAVTPNGTVFFGSTGAGCYRGSP